MKPPPIKEVTLAETALPSGRPAKRWNGRWIGYAAALVVLVLVIAYFLRPAPVPVDVAAVARGDLQVVVAAEGRTRVRDRYVISAMAEGHLDRIVLREGDPVRRGQIVAHVDRLPLDSAVREAEGRLREWQAQRDGVATLRPKAEALAQARARVQAADAARAQAEARVAQARLGLAQAQRDRERALRLEANGALSRQDREAAELEARSQAEELRAAGLAVRAALFEAEAARAALNVLQRERRDPDYLVRVYDARIAAVQAELARLRQEAGRSEIRSPVAGRVLRVLQKSARFVADGTPLLEIGDAEQLELVIDVLSADAERIRPGAAIVLEMAAPVPRTRVRLVEPSAFTEVSALGVEEQRVNVIGDFLDRPVGLGDGYRVDARIVVSERKNVVKAPLGSLFRCGAEWCAFVVDEGRARLRMAKVGKQSDEEAEIVAGLGVGERVVLFPPDRVSDGTRVADAR